MISDATITLVKERTDIVAVIGDVVRLKRRGRTVVGLCPFHQEKTPSFHVNAERGFFHCFGCKASGSVIDFVMKSDGYSFPEAIRVLAERANIEVEDTRTDAERREAAAAKRAREDLYGVSAAAATYYEGNLAGAAPHKLGHYAVDEVERRGLTVESAQAFRLGYAPPGWDGLATWLRKQGLSLTAAERAGLLVARSSGGGYYDRFRHRLMFPVIDLMGRVVAFSGRALPEPSASDLQAVGMQPQRGVEPPAKYINSPESPIYTKGEHVFGLYQARQAIRQADHAILVEGNFDVVALHARGLCNVVGPLGTAFTTPQAKLLRRFSGSVVVLFDGDAAGAKATRAAREPCRDAALTVRVGCMPSGIDPDELVRKRGLPAIERIVANAKGMLEYLIDDALEPASFTDASLEAQAERVQVVMGLLRSEQDPTLRGLAKTYADRLAVALIVGGKAPTDLRQLEQDVADAIGGDDAKAAKKRVVVQHGPGRSLLGALLEFPALLDDAEVQTAVQCVEGPLALAIAAVSRHRSDIALMLAAIPATLRDFAAERCAQPMFDTIDQAKRVVLDNAVACHRLNMDGAKPDTSGTEDERLRRLHDAMKRRAR